MTTILKPCPVPWSMYASGAGLTLHHVQDDEPECAVVITAGRLMNNGRLDQRRAELKFSDVLHARIGTHRDNESIEAIGYEVDYGYEGPDDPYQFLKWADETWNALGICPYSKFYVASESDWLSNLQLSNEFRHYVLDDSDGYVELISTGYPWQEWFWAGGYREDVVTNGKVVATGTEQQ